MTKELREDILDTVMMASFNAGINNLILGKYEPPNMIDKCIDDINKIWELLLQEYFKEIKNESITREY